MSSLNPVHIPRILTIAESYNDGNNGIQADLKTFTALSTFGLSIITALVARDNSNAHVIHTIPTDFISSQFRSVTTDNNVNALKISTVLSSTSIDCIVSLIRETKIPIVVFDAALITKQLAPDSLRMLREQLLSKVTLATSTIEEAAILLDRQITSFDDMKCAARDLHHLGAKYVLIKSDQIFDNSEENDVLLDILFDGVEFTLFKTHRLPHQMPYSTRSICSAAVTAFLAYGIEIKQAIEDSIAYTHFVVQRSEAFDRDNNALECSRSVLDKQQQQQQPLSENQSWIKEPCVLPQPRSFVQLLKNVCAQEWYDYTHHEFVQNLANDTLPQASFKHYLIQDYIFLTHFARCYALAAYKSNNMAEILLATRSVCYIGDEVDMHVSYCATWGIDRTSLNTMKEARANLAYTRFTLDCGMTGDLLDLYVALAPCLMGYGEVGARLNKDPQTNHDSPYSKWILSYACDNYQEACRKGERLIERLADDYGVWHASARIKKLTDIFRTATKLEIGFWNMGLNIEW